MGFAMSFLEVGNIVEPALYLYSNTSGQFSSLKTFYFCCFNNHTIVYLYSGITSFSLFFVTSLVIEACFTILNNEMSQIGDTMLEGGMF